MGVSCLAVSSLLSALQPSVSEEMPSRALPLAASIQMGAGFLAEDAAALLQPRLSLTAEQGELTLAAPLWVRLAKDVHRYASDDDVAPSPAWPVRTNDPQTYLGYLERLTLVTRGRAVRAEAGSLTQQTIGHGVLVDQYQATLDPLRPRTGGRVDLDVGPLAASLMSDSFVRPHLVAIAITATPPGLVGPDPDRRLRISLEGAVDPFTPTATRAGMVNAEALDVAYAVVARDTLGLELFAAAATLGGETWGGHLGAELSWHNGPGLNADALKLRVDSIGAQPGYVPQYFDVGYALERRGVVGTAISAKQNREQPGGFGGRLSFDGRAHVTRFGASLARLGASQPFTATAYVGVTTTRASVAATYMQRSLLTGKELVDLGYTGTAMVEAAVTVHDHLFLFGHARRGFRIAADGPHPVTDWVAGLGYGGSTAGG